MDIVNIIKNIRFVKDAIKDNNNFNNKYKQGKNYCTKNIIDLEIDKNIL